MRNRHRLEGHHNGSGTGLALGRAPAAGSAVDELVLKLAEGFRERMPERRLQVFHEALDGIPLEAVRMAYVTIRDSDEFDRLPPPGKLRAMALRARQLSDSRSPSLEELEARRATPQEIEEVFAELKTSRADSPFVQVLIAQHEHDRRRMPQEARRDTGHNTRH